MTSEVLLIGGRAGVGKSTTGHEVHILLTKAQVHHCLIEGDNLDMAYPTPWEHKLAEKNLAAMWRNYRALGHARLIYTNTVSVTAGDEISAAMGDEPRVIGVLLTCSDQTARQRLAAREIGNALEWHVQRSDRMARELDSIVPAWVHRVPTDDRSVSVVAQEVVTLTGWLSAPAPQ